ncbi:MAG: DinB family protein [Vicinamibacterales bacterium]
MPLPYAEYVGDRDPVEMLELSLEEYQTVLPGLTDEMWSRPLAAGKWTMRQVMVHVAQWEMIWAVRIRCAVWTPDYVMQSIEQDDLMFEAEVVDGPMACRAFDSVRRMNIAAAKGLTRTERRRAAQHAAIGTVRVDDLLVTLAGHSIHHLRQLQSASAAR